MPSPSSSRRYARRVALQTLYGSEVGHRDAADVLAETGGRLDAAARGFTRDLVLGTLEHVGESDAVIAPLLEGWTLERLPTIDRILLRMAVYELRHRPETPAAVVINEAVELAKSFSTENSARFVNGVLDRAAHLRGTAEALDGA